MTTTVRTLIALVLCLLLPLQAGATLARSAAMAVRSGMPPQATTALHRTVDKLQAATLQHHAAAHHAHAAHSAHSAHNFPDAQPNHAPSGDAGFSVHKTAHAKSGCVDCAKCCLLAASAPPPGLPPSFAPAAARASFVSQRAPAPAFITEGPERPPRHLTA